MITLSRTALRVVRTGTLGPIRRDVAARWLASEEPTLVMYALLRLSLNGPDFAFAETMALKHAAHPDEWVRRNAATSLSHVARIHGSIELDAVMAALVAMLDDPEACGWADDALDEVEIYMNTDRRRYMAASTELPLQRAAP